MRQGLRPDPEMRPGPGANQFLVHASLEGQALDVRLVAMAQGRAPLVRSVIGILYRMQHAGTRSCVHVKKPAWQRQGSTRGQSRLHRCRREAPRARSHELPMRAAVRMRTFRQDVDFSNEISAINRNESFAAGTAAPCARETPRQPCGAAGDLSFRLTTDVFRFLSISYGSVQICTPGPQHSRVLRSFIFSSGQRVGGNSVDCARG
jgi:hypothetical protein